MALLAFIFLLGVGNFELLRAVLDSAHPVLRQIPWLRGLSGPRIGLSLEFAMLLATMLMVRAGAQGWAWFYMGYSTVNAISAWVILGSRR